MRKNKGISSIEKGVHYILEGLRDEFGLDSQDANFEGTPERVARAYAEIFAGMRDTNRQIQEILGTAFPAKNDQLILAKGIEVFSMCPHHLLPVSYKVHVAYIPSLKKGRVIGISKLARLVEVLARRPVLQEQLVEDVSTSLMDSLDCEGAACVAEGIHYCMVMRGVKQTYAKTIASSMKGVFRTDTSTRAELFQLINRE